MQTVYIGNTLVNDFFIGNVKASNVISNLNGLVTSSLIAWFDAESSASAANWRTTTYGNRTGSLSGGAGYKSSYLPSYEFSSSLSTIGFGTPPVTGTSSRTYTIWVKSQSTASLSVIQWNGSAASGDFMLIGTAYDNNRNSLYFRTLNSSSIVIELPEFNLNEWNCITLTTDGTNTWSAFNIWFNDQKYEFSGGTTWTTPSINASWELGLKDSSNPYSGSIFSQLVYNRELNDNEILQNYSYYRYRLGFY
jgi:hypothetical protein